MSVGGNIGSCSAAPPINFSVFSCKICALVCPFKCPAFGQLLNSFPPLAWKSEWILGCLWSYYYWCTLGKMGMSVILPGIVTVLGKNFTYLYLIWKVLGQQKMTLTWTQECKLIRERILRTVQCFPLCLCLFVMFSVHFLEFSCIWSFVFGGFGCASAFLVWFDFLAWF